MKHWKDVVSLCGREQPDHVGDRYVAPQSVIDKLPARLDLRDDIVTPWASWYQGSWNSCTAHAVGGAIWYLARRHAKLDHAKRFEPSRGFIFGNEERMASIRLGYTTDNALCYMHEAVDAVKTLGVCAEEQWPYDKWHFDNVAPPPLQAAAKKHQPVHNWKVDLDAKQIKACLAEGYPVTIGLVMFAECEPNETNDGHFPVPNKSGPRRGGHAILIIGYDDPQERFLIRNSWGKHWGDGGFGTLPYAYALDSDLSDSTWTIRYRE